MSLEVQTGGVESFRIPWAESDGGPAVDPTSPVLVVAYALGTVDGDAPTAGWVAGAWFDDGAAIVQIDGRQRTGYWSRTPTIGAIGTTATLTAAAGDYELWGRLLEGAETLTRRIDRVVIH